MAGSTGFHVQKSEEEWRAILSPEQFKILRQKGTELKGEVQYFIGVQLDNSQHVEPLHNCITENTTKEGEQLILCY